MTTPQLPKSKATMNEKPALHKVLSTATVGFLSSSRAERAPLERMKPSVEAFRNFLSASGLGIEISSSLNFSLLPRLGLLSQIQTIINERNDRRMLSRVVTTNHNYLPTSQEALKYMRYATAVYGVDMIAAGGRKLRQQQKPSPEDAKNNSQKANPKDTRTWISEHIGIPPNNIMVLDVDYSPETNHDHLRHFVAVDHASQKVVLSIRGTFSLSEIMVDITAYSRPCPVIGGEAHAEIYNMAEKIWAASGDKIVDLLREHEGYELIVTGHSLGAGCACVINMMCQCDNRKLIDGRSIRCFAFACPPVFCPLDIIPEAMQSTTNYILEQDIVPFLSVDSVRHVFYCLRVIEDYMQASMSVTERMNLTLARTQPPEGMIEAVVQASGMRLEPKEGAPVLSIPAAANVWMKECPSSTGTCIYDFEVCDSLVLS